MEVVRGPRKAFVAGDFDAFRLETRPEPCDKITWFSEAFPNHLHLARGNHETRNMNKLYGFEGEVTKKCRACRSKLGLSGTMRSFTSFSAKPFVYCLSAMSSTSRQSWQTHSTCHSRGLCSAWRALLQGWDVAQSSPDMFQDDVTLDAIRKARFSRLDIKATGWWSGEPRLRAARRGPDDRNAGVSRHAVAPDSGCGAIRNP